MEPREVEKARIKYLHSCLKKLYFEAGVDRRKLSIYELSNPSPTTILGEIASASSDIAGCSTRIIRDHAVHSISELLDALDKAYIFRLDHVHEWYLDNSEEYEKLKLYVDVNEYLRLLIVEYFHKYMKNQF